MPASGQRFLAIHRKTSALRASSTVSDSLPAEKTSQRPSPGQRRAFPATGNLSRLFGGLPLALFHFPRGAWRQFPAERGV
jgi:hypothetical protein